ncbi:glutamate--tRNA ligase [Variibacter gotjawalensis]|uniref:Glutamate--tRNA ligase n=1 Tax=Variibacter gotjawalensis TaxID=1333996 RepID=A0A0S3PQ02_9BRAD|nr:tRNA glutamyl-Q(34) synthetase GluQRS [Variibacter gotjawalensis]NIK48319.1 glutamyl-Q tRNA(Asp) synthetase [Variibacter gotjawalensis]RZS50190.1 glutamyl-Q tRNA(Asp) synthetase [Variibacter gotjawalensis]BAT58021.1 glutamate--tRNA ligase [Variibacter gotjawalensis]
MRRYRFAPSPNGYLHLGHAYSALLNARMAAETGGECLLRIEDIDQGRARPEFEAAIDEDLAWLGLTWPKPVRRQSEHFALYRDAIAKLEAMGLVYPSFESRAEIAALVADKERDGTAWPRDPDGAPLYPGKRLDEITTQARIANGDAYALRLDMAAALKRTGPLTWDESGSGETGTIAADAARWGDVVLARKDMPTSYHVSVVVDDAEQNITDVVRGQDLFHATAIHRVLQTLLNLPAPRYHHHRLLRGDDDRKLAKSEHAKALRALRAEGVTPDEIRRIV